MEQPAQQQHQQNAVSLKLPAFWTSQPKVWFQQSEAQFALRNITTDDTKYYYVVAALDQDSAKRVIDFLENPPEENKYTAFKRRLLGAYDLSESERAARLLNMPPLGDRKPSELMDEMLGLMNNHRPCFLFNFLFLQLLPEEIRIVLSGLEQQDPRQLAQRADALWLTRSQAPPVFRVQAPKRKTAAANYSSANDECFYHRRFGARARCCVPPCSYQGNESAGRR